ncbi:MAG TPA: tyrosine-type recombinase/integrase [Phycisphaerae bacterium]|nr:tyrosine-type recombinase/integrase [Phycisphaerae bacterium]
MQNDTKKPPRVKPAKPYPDFPLFPHDTGRWAKKVLGKTRYFGQWEDADGALNKWLEQRDDLMAGREPKDAKGQLTILDAINAFLTAKKRAVETRDLTERSFRDYHETCDRVIGCIGKTPAVANLGPADFSKFVHTMRTWAPVTRSNEIQRVRTLFKYAYDAALIDKPVAFGPDFKKPSAKVIRADKASKPKRLFSREDVRTLLKATAPQMRAMILLGINCGLGNSDISEMNINHLDLDAGILDYPRPKTSIDRRAALWPETVKALRLVMKRRGEVLTVGDNAGKPRYRPEDPADANAVFLTHQSRRFVRQDGKNNRDSVALAFGKLLRAKGIKREGRNFYSLRHTFESIASGAKDQAAVDRVMGHVDSHVRGHYQHWSKDAEEDTRLKSIADHVRKWLFGAEVDAGKGQA